MNESVERPSSIGMKRLDLHGTVVAVLRPTSVTRGLAVTTNREATMDSIQIDLHKRESQLNLECCARTEQKSTPN